MIKNQILKMNKKLGETPLECLERFRKANPKYKNDKMTYAGRLDPLASGVLLVLTGNECKNKEKYLGLDKEYEVEILFGFSTDTGDVLGLVTDSGKAELNINKVKKSLESFLGIKTRLYPKYSSPALAGAKIREKSGEIKLIKFLSNKYISSKLLNNNIKEKVNLVKGDFRQEKILKGWAKKLIIKPEKYLVVKIKVRTSAGVYMRQLAQEIGQKFMVPSLALKIKRTKIYL